MEKPTSPRSYRPKVKIDAGLTQLAPMVPPVQAPIVDDGQGVLGSSRLRLGRMVETNGASSLERVEGFDAYLARNRGLFPETPLTAPPSRDGNFAPENVIGRDDRVPVGDTTRLPWRTIAMLTITYENGQRSLGTAWFLGPKALATAGHNIRDTKKGRAREILVTPGYDGVRGPFGTFAVAQTYCDPAWLAGDNEPELDYGVLLMSDATVGSRLDWFGLASYTDPQLVPLLVNVSGYAADRTPHTQYYTGGRIEETAPQFLLYSFDTEGGMSGAPIFALFGEKRVAVGIHTYGSDRINRARRIDDGLFDILARFV